MFYLILLFAFLLRLYGINWDSGFHLHPDERMLIIVADRIHFFKNLDPDFFNYGSLPIYILNAISQLIDFIFKTNLANYNNMLYIGRTLSITADLLTIFLIYKITQLLFSNLKISKKQKEKLYILPPLLYSITFFPIQNSHFFIVDNFLNLFSTLLLLLILKSLDEKNFSFKRLLSLAIVSAAILTTKISGIIFVAIAEVLLFLKLVYKAKTKKLFGFAQFLILNFAFLIFNFIFMPYAFLRFSRFFSDITLQANMNSDPYIFPYTLQYVGTLPYFYYLKNIFLWGAGPVISFLAIVGLFFLFKNFEKTKKNPQLILFSVYYGLYFLVLGKSAVKFMRYMLPLYPAIAVLGGYGAYQISKLKIKNSKFKIIFILLLQLFYLSAFLSIYSKPNTRLQATEWILKNIPYGKTLAVEHWDDRLPLYGSERYKFIELPLYNLPDNAYKWRNIHLKLLQADYIIIASNRLYTPLQKLEDCRKYKICYPKTAKYYRDLFTRGKIVADFGILKFQKVAEFTSYPEIKIPFTNISWKINDQSADESFTVYDHPRVMIFKKIQN